MSRKSIKIHHELTEYECKEISDIIIEMLGPGELYGGYVKSGSIDYAYHVDALNSKATTSGVLTVDVCGDFGDDENGEFLSEARIQFKLEGPDYYSYTDDDGYEAWEQEDFYYSTLGTRVLNMFLTPDEIY